MGMSPSADLFYGYDLDGLLYDDDYNDLRPRWWQDGEEWEEHLARKRGWVEVPFPPNITDPPWNMPYEEQDRIRKAQEELPEYKVWSESRSELHRLTSEFDIEVDSYGYCEDPTWTICVKASQQRCSDYGSTTVTPLVVDPTWDAQLVQFLELLEFTLPVGAVPGWHMTCSYG